MEIKTINILSELNKKDDNVDVFVNLGGVNLPPIVVGTPKNIATILEKITKIFLWSALGICERSN